MTLLPCNSVSMAATEPVWGSSAEILSRVLGSVD
jgi:hypothetical protein